MEKKIKFKYILLLIILFIIIFFEINLYLKIHFIKNFKNGLSKFYSNRKIIKTKEKNISSNHRNNKELRIDILKKGKIYINKCLNGSLLNKYRNHSNILIIPLISVIIPIFNCEKTITASIRSIQNQNISEIEIILINDFSKDNSLKIVENLKNEDLRIKIINNNKNMGTLYSRCIGVLMAKGNYIFPLDNDDMFFDEDVFDYIYKIGINGNFDIIEFKTVLINNYNYSVTKIRDHPLSHHKNKLILHQPELGLFPISKNGKYQQNDINIWGKCIKKEIYKKSVNSLGSNRYSKFISWAEDTSMVFIIFNIAKSFIFIHKYGVIHLFSSSTASFTQSKNITMFGEIFLIDIFFDFLKNNTSKNFVADHILQKHYLKNIKNENNKIYFKSILKKILSNKYITKFNKEKIIKDYSHYFNK